MDYVSCTLTLILYIYCVQFARLDWDKIFKVYGSHFVCQTCIRGFKLDFSTKYFNEGCPQSIHFNRTYRIKVEVDKSEKEYGIHVRIFYLFCIFMNKVELSVHALTLVV